MEKSLATNELVQETKAMVLAIKRNYLAISANVYRLYEAWTGSPDEWCRFYEEELELSKSQVSKMRQVGAFVLAHGLLNKTDVSYERLYLSISRNKDKDPKYILAEAQSWSPRDYLDARKEECKNPDFHLTCKNCHATKENHA